MVLLARSVVQVVISIHLIFSISLHNLVVIRLIFIVSSGYKIPKGWKVILWVRYLHTNSEIFDDPLCFNPDRWNVSLHKLGLSKRNFVDLIILQLNLHVLSHQDPAKPGTYQVFGGGARICAGNMLVRIQLALLLHHLSTGYK